MSSFKDLVKQVNEGKYKTVSATGQKQSSNEKEEEKKSSFRDLVKQVNDGSFNVSSKLKGSDVSTWYSKVSDIGKRSSDFLKTEGYRKSDTSLEDEIEQYLSQSADVGQFIRANKTSFSNYDDTISTYYQAVNYLRDLKSGVKSSNEYYSQWKSEEDYNSYVSQQKDYEAKKSFDVSAGEKEITELKKKRSELANATTSRQPASSYLIGSPVNATSPYAASQSSGTYNKELADLDALISQKSAYLNQAKRIQEGIALAGVVESADFDDYKGYSSTKSDSAWGRLTSDYGMGYDDLTYEYINNKNGIRNEIKQKSKSYSSDSPFDDGESIFEERGYDFMNNSEVSIYNYYYAKEGKEAAEKYLDSIQESLNLRKATSMYGNLEDNTALELAFGIAAGLDQFESGVKNLFNSEDSYIPQTATQMASGMVREDLADVGPKLPDWLGGASIGQVGYDTITTTSNMAPSIMTSMALGIMNPAAGQWAGTALMGASAAGNAYQEALNMGYDKGQARMYAALVGGSEAGLQYLLGGIGSLGGKLSGNAVTKIMNGVDNAFARTAIKLGGNMLSEGVEEGLQEILTPWFQNLIMHTDEDINWSEVAYSTLLGALTAGFMEGGTTISGEVNTYKTGKQLQAADISAQRLAEIGNTFSADTVAHQLAGKANENTGAYTIGRLFNEIGATLTEQNVNDITQALVEKGMTEDMARANARAMAVVVEGGNLTEAQVKVIEANEILAEAVRTTIIDSNATWFQRTKGYNEALMALAQEKTSPSTSQAGTSQQGKENAPAVDKVDAQEENSAEGLSEVSEVDIGPAKVKNIATIKDGQVTVKLDDGSEVNVREADLHPDDGVRIETIAGIDGISSEDANFILNTLRTTTNASAQMDSLGAKEAYKYGFYGFSQDHMTKHGVFANSLTDTQRQAIYDTGRNARKLQVEKAQATVAKNATTGKKTSGKVHFDGDRNALTERQSASLTAMEKIADALGVQIYVFESELGENGKRIGANGWYDPKDGSIHIDLHAGAKGEGTMLFTAAHELTHFIKQWSPVKFKTLSDFLMQEYGKKGVSVDALVREQMAKAKRNGRTISYDTAYEEVIADSMETMLSDGNVMEKLAKLKKKDKSLWKKIKDFINELAAKIRSVYDGLAPDSVEGRYVAEMVDSIERLQDLFTDALVEASENYQSSLTPGVEGTIVNANGDPVAHSTADGTIQLSMRTYEEEGREAFRKYLQKCVSSKKLTKAEMQEMLDGIDDIYQTCKEFKDKYAPFSSWSDAAVVRDTYGKPVFSVVTPNGDYKMNLDFSLVCKKRRTLDAVFNEMSRRGIIDDFELGQKSVVKINEIIRKYGLETACALCFVDAKRFRQASMADSFTRLYNELVLSLVPEEQRSSIEHFNFSGYETIKKVGDGIHTWDKSKLDFSHINEVLKTYGDGTVEYKAANYIKSHAEGRKLLLRGDFMSSQGFDAVKTQNPDVLKLYNSKKGTGGPKAAFGDVQYMNEIIQKARWWTPKKAYEVGGIRIQSFSDYVPRMVFDYVQMIYDLAATKLPAHAYTKEALFVKQFGLTGVKINMSLIPAIAEGGIAPGLDANGNYVWAGESFDFETAKQIQNAPGYTENCGTICVGVSDRHIRKLLSDPDIRMVIPYHKSGLNPIVAHMNKIAEFTDYTNKQNTTVKETGSKAEKHFDFNAALHKMGKNADPRAVIQQYFDWCDDNGYEPKFAEFRDHPNYYKLIEDFTLYDKDGNYVPQREVRAVFPKEGAAFGSMKELIQEGLQEDAVIEGKRDSSLSKIVDEIQRVLPKTEAEISEDQVTQADRDLEAEVKNSDRDYMVAVNRGDMEAAQRMVNEAAKRAGFIPGLYHGTQKYGFTKFDLSKMDDGQSIFLTDNLDVAESYSGTQLVKNPGAPSVDVGSMSLDEVIKEYNKLNTHSSEWNVVSIDDKIDKLTSDLRKQGKIAADYLERIDSIIPILKELKATDDHISAAKEWLRNIAVFENATEDSLAAADAAYMDTVQAINYRNPVYRILSGSFDLSVLSNNPRFARKAYNIRKSGDRAVEQKGHPYTFASETELRERLEDLLDIDNLSDVGNYALCAKIEKPLRFDAGGSYWDQMRFIPKEAKPYLKAVKEAQKRCNETMGEGGYGEANEALMNAMHELGNFLDDLGLDYPESNTRQIAAYAKRMGYDGVIFEDIIDVGEHAYDTYISNVYVVFDPANVKSTEPVTYDDNGNVIPLSERFKSDNDDIRYSDRTGGFQEHDVVSAVYTIRHEKAQRGHDLVKIGTMPTLYRDLFDLNGDVYVSNEHLYQNMVSRATAEAEGRFKADASADYHELGEPKVINAIEQFQDPLVIMESLKDFNEPRLVAILDEKGNDGQNLLAVMELYAPVTYPGKNQRRNHVLITIYEKNSLPDYIEKTVDKGRILHKKEGLHQTRQAGLQLAGAVSEETLKKNVARFNKKVKDFKAQNKISYSDRDSTGAQLTKEQQEFFKDSKMRDELGRLIAMYHGTNDPNFTVFDPQYSDDQRSLFFTSDPDVANTYTHQQDHGRDVDPYNLITKDSSAAQFNAAQEKAGGGLRVIQVTQEWIDEMNRIATEKGAELIPDAEKYADLLKQTGVEKVINCANRILAATSKGAEKLTASDVSDIQRAFYDSNQAMFLNKNAAVGRVVREMYRELNTKIDRAERYAKAAEMPVSAIGKYTYIERNSMVPFSVATVRGPAGSVFAGSESEAVELAIDRTKWVHEHSLGNRYKVYLNLKNPYILDAGKDLSGKMDRVAMSYSYISGGWRIELEYGDEEMVKHMSKSDFEAFVGAAFDAKISAKIKAQIEADNDAYRRQWGDLDPDDVDHDIQLENVNISYVEPGNWNDLHDRAVADYFELDEDESLKTRNVAKYAMDHGYDGVIFKNMKDTGGYAFMKGRNASTVAVAFNSNQVKSVDNKKPTADPDIRYSYRGEKAKNIDKAALNQAKTLDKQGVPMKEIRSRTGWWKQSDGKWRNEFATKDFLKPEAFNHNGLPSAIEARIAAHTERVNSWIDPDDDFFTEEDAKAEIESYATALRKHGINYGKLSEFLDAPELYEAYPHFKDIRVAIGGARGETDGLYVPSENEIRLRKNYGGRSLTGREALLHEIQHAIQEYEGFSKGTSVERAGSYDAYLKNKGETEARDVAERWRYTDEERQHYDPVYFSERTGDSVSNRSLLANALESVVQNQIEAQAMAEYKRVVPLLDQEERRLQKLNDQIKELSFAKGPKDTKKIKELQFEARQTANRINTFDRQLLRMEASKPIQAVLDREKKMAYKRAEQKGKQALDAYREKATKTQRELMDKWQESRKKGIDSRNRTAMRHKIKDIVNELNQYLLHGNKDKRVMMPLRKAVAEALDAVNMDTVGAEERIAKLEQDLMKAKTPEQIQEISRKIDHIREMGDKMSNRLKALKDAYREISESDDPLIANAHDDVIEAKLESVIENVGDTPLRDMNLAQLEEVYDMYRMVLTTIRNANKAFKAAKSESISSLGNRVMMEIDQMGGKKKYSIAALEAVKKFGWNNLKPVYAFEHIGSDTFTEIFSNVRAGEDVWAVDVTEAREFYLDKSKKYRYHDWDFIKRFNFKSTSGMDFSLNLEQIMSLYAYSKRDQAADHLKRGGIVFDETTEVTMKTKLGIPVKFNPTEATAYNISDETLAAITSKLTDEQKGFVDEMQEYLSTVMGAKGNEVSLELYGIKLFKEKFYFPLKSASQFMAKAKEQQQGEVKIKNSGFSKETVKKASNPIVLTPFMKVWSNHVNEMSMYHAFVLPMEDFYRVYNYRTPTSDSMATESVEMFLQNAYGKGATQYIDQLLKDLNGGARTDSRTGIINKMMGLFKKGAVFASLSVVVQQPSAIARAAALVDMKYFIGPKVDRKRHSLLWDEVKRYAPVAIIKEMGYFDTNMGKSTQDFITGKEYSSISEKMKALVTDSNYRDEVLSKAPALADEMAWCAIWDAVKREMHDKHPGLDVKGEPFLMLAGSRFTEVITKTQVYDSVLARSANMRSKDTGMKMATSFMAEPTTSINMIADALLQGKRGNRKYCRSAIGAVIASNILNSILVSFVYAGRDDDEDETYAEKYIGTLTAEILDGMNPATYIPFIKDIVSIVQGYDVERSDMAVVSDLWNAYQKLGNSKLSTYRKVEGFAGSIAQIFGLPVKNIMRDVRGIYQTVMSFVNGQQTTKAGIKYAVKSALPAWLGGGNVSNQEQLYEAYLSGDKDHAARVESRYKDESAINSAMRSVIKDHYLAGDISSETAKDHLVTYAATSEKDAYWKAEEWEYESETGEDFSKYNEFFTAVETGKNLKTVIKQYTDNGVKESTLKSQLSEHFKPLYIEMPNSERAGIKGYLLNAMTILGDTREDAEEKIAKWQYEADYPELADRITYTQYKRWQTDGKPNGVSLELYTDVAEFRDDGTSSSAKSQEEVAEYINSLPISTAQKDALWCCFWKESTLKKAPWH